MRIYRKGYEEETEEQSYLKGIYSIPKLSEIFLESKRAQGRQETTIYMYGHAIKLLCDYLDAKEIRKDVRNVSTDDLRGFVSWLMTERTRNEGHKHKSDADKAAPLSRRTALDYAKMVKGFYRFITEEDYIRENPAEKLDNPKYVEKDIEIMTAEEVRALFNAPNIRRYADFRDFVIMHLLIDSMCRIGEALSLKVRDIDFTKRTVYFRASTTKNRKPRIVPIGKKTARLMKELAEEISDFNSEYIFLANNGEVLRPNNYAQRLEHHSKTARLSRKINPHLFRHTGATMFLENGGDIRHLQMILGHSDMRMVQRYTHLTSRSITDQHDRYSALNSVQAPLQKDRKILR